MSVNRRFWTQDLHTGQHQERKEAGPYRRSEWALEAATPVAKQWNTAQHSQWDQQQYEVHGNISTIINVPSEGYSNWQRIFDVVSEVWQVEHWQTFRQHELTEIQIGHTSMCSNRRQSEGFAGFCYDVGALKLRMTEDEQREKFCAKSLQRNGIFLLLVAFRSLASSCLSVCPVC